jgi:hypothetical protein
MAQDFSSSIKIPERMLLSFYGEVFRADREGAKIATVLGAYLYDLKDNLVGYLHGHHVVDALTQSMALAFRKLLEGKS